MRTHLTALAAGVIAVVLATGQLLAAAATPLPAPEIDATSVSAGLGIVTAGILILRARRR